MKIAIRREDEGRALEALRAIAITPVRVEESSLPEQNHLLRVVLPDLSREQRHLLAERFPTDLFAFNGIVLS